jgi:hypothetical protein
MGARKLGVVAATVLAIGAAGLAPTAAAAAEASAAARAAHPYAEVYCSTWTSNGVAHANCDIRSGEARVRADCVNYPDLYSPWRGRGNWHLWTGQCPWGIRGAIMETRG